MTRDITRSVFSTASASSGERLKAVHEYEGPGMPAQACARYTCVNARGRQGRRVGELSAFYMQRAMSNKGVYPGRACAALTVLQGQPVGEVEGDVAGRGGGLVAVVREQGPWRRSKVNGRR